MLDLFPLLCGRAGSKSSQLSGGEQHMLAIARALVSDPKMREEGVTILLVEQNMKLAEVVADELHIMVKGRMVYRASPAVFRAEEETIRARFLTV
jgi:branched-chain amino acid transport system ATP-binding protein